MSATDHFSQDTAGRSQSRATEIVDVEPGGSFELRIAPVTKRLGDGEVCMLAYNGSVPGPTLRVAEGSQIEVGVLNAFSRSETSHAAMGRFGNVLLVAGEPELALEAREGEVVRLYLTNTANTRVFKVKLPGARMKLVGGDSGRCEREEIVEEAILAPSERVILDVLFERAGELALEHHTPKTVYRLASIAVSDEPTEPSLAESFEQLRRDPELSAERADLDRHLTVEPGKTLAARA